jgi:hypothetical protein
MDIKEKRILVSLLSSVLVILFYWWYVYSNYIADNPAILNDFKFWGTTFIILIPVAIGIQIVIQIIFAIVTHILSKGEEIDPIEDERDKLIELKAIKISHYLFILGFCCSNGHSGNGHAALGDVCRAYFIGFRGQYVERNFKTVLLQKRSLTWLK